MKLNIPKSILNRVKEKHENLPLIKVKKKYAKKSEAMRKRWADPVQRAILCEASKRSALKRKYSIQGFKSLQHHMRTKVNTPEHYKNRDRSYLKTPKFRKNSSIIMLEYHRKRREKEQIEIRERVNDFCGVLTESDMATM